MCTLCTRTRCLWVLTIPPYLMSEKGWSVPFDWNSSFHFLLLVKCLGNHWLIVTCSSTTRLTWVRWVITTDDLQIKWAYQIMLGKSNRHLSTRVKNCWSLEFLVIVCFVPPSSLCLMNLINKCMSISKVLLMSGCECLYSGVCICCWAGNSSSQAWAVNNTHSHKQVVH